MMKQKALAIQDTGVQIGIRERDVLGQVICVLAVPVLIFLLAVSTNNYF